MSDRPVRSPESLEDIAVVGVACLFPGASGAGVYWRNILSKVDAITDPPAEAWDPGLSYDPASGENDRVYCRKGGYLGPLAYFDPLEYGIMPRATEGGEPDQWLALHVAREALRDAGCPDASAYRERAALILGKGTYANRGILSVMQHAIVVDYTLSLLKSIHPALSEADLALLRADLKRRLPRFDAETAPALIPNVTVGRIANRLDFMGPCYTVDAACASSLVAVDIAVKGLRQHEYDLAVVGGLQAATPVPVLSLFCQLRALSPSERIRPFDKDADGTLLSEGIGMAVLKRRSQAERDGDRIYAFVKGTGVASDGRAVGVLAPRVEGEELALRRAYEGGGVAPATVGLIEAHGTGTPVGDATEVEALTRVFGARGQAPRCALGSVKSMIGHTMPASGMAGFIKAVLSLYHKVLPPTLHVDQPNPRLGLERTPFYLNTETRPWIHGDAQPRRAGINSFGFGGINAHVVVEEAPPSNAGATLDTEWDSEVCLFSGATREEVVALVRRVAAVLAWAVPPALADIASSLSAHAPARATSGRTLGIVARSTDDLARKLARALEKLEDPATQRIKDAGGIYYFDEPLAHSGRVAFVFPGEGAQYVNMLSDLCRHFPVVRECFDAMDRVLFNHPRGYRVSEFVFPPPSFSAAEREAAERRLGQMDVAIESVTVANRAITLLFQQLGIVPDVILGHSSGEFSAMRAAGMFDEDGYDERVVELNDDHGRVAQAGELPGGARLIAVGAARERVEALCAAAGVPVFVAMDNCPHQVVVAAEAGAAAKVEASLRAEGLLYEALSLDRPYHTPFFTPFADTLNRALRQWIVRPAAVPLYSCTSTEPYPADLPDAHELAYLHWVRPVEFSRTIERMWNDGVRIFVEAGPRGNLTAFIEDILAGRSYAAVPADVSRRSGLTQLHHLLAYLAAHGVAMTLAPLYQRRRTTPIDWSTDPKPPANGRLLGKVKLPTGAPEMRLSPEMIELVRRRAGSSRQPAATPAMPPPVAAAEPNSPVRLPAPAPSPAVQPLPARDEATVPARQAAPPATRPGAPQAMAAYFQTMERFLSVERTLVGGALSGPPQAGRPPNRPAASQPPRAGAALVELVEHSGASLRARCTFDLDRQPFLRDHTIGRDVSADDPSLSGFPIVPFTALMETMAEAAVLLAPGHLVTGMRDVRVLRWLAVDRGAVQLDLLADRTTGTEVAVRVVEAGPTGLGPVAEGVMVLGTQYPQPPQSAGLALANEQPYKWPPAQLYAEAMFHGPLFRGVQAITRFGDDGAEAALTVIARRTLLGAADVNGLATDLVLLDQPGQVVGFWANQRLEHGFVVLPSRMAALHLYGPILPHGDKLTCRARIALVGDRQVRSDLDVIDASGRLWARFEGWEDHRFDVPGDVYRALLQPEAAGLARPWPAIGEAARGLTAYRIGLDRFPPGWLHAHGGMWSRVLAALVLGRRERELWHGMKAPERRRLEWLLGRIAAKDAVRDFVSRRFHLSLRPADVEILPDVLGRPVVAGAWTAQIGSVPLVSISHVDGAAVAVLTDGNGISGVGIDLERRGRMRPGMEGVMFNAVERALLDGLDGENRDTWALRLWCAKEASAKATGCTVGPASAHLTVEQVDREDGVVVLRCRTPTAGSVTLTVSTAREGDWIVATCIDKSSRTMTEVRT